MGIFYAKWLYDLSQRCEVIFYQDNLNKLFRSGRYGTIF